MADRPSKRARRQISEDSTDSLEEESSRDHWSSERQRKAKKGGRAEAAASTADTMSRPRRVAATSTVANPDQPSSITVSRSPSDSPEDRRKSIKLTVKMPSSKLREVTSQSSVDQANFVSSRDTFEPDRNITGRRSARVRETAMHKVYNEDDDSETSDESDDEDEDNDDEGDEEMDLGAPNPFTEFSTPEDESTPPDDEEFEESHPFPPNQGHPRPAPGPTPQQKPKKRGRPPTKPALVVTPAADGPIKSVEEKEMEMENDEDDELSELNSNAEEEDLDDANLDEEGDEDELGAEDDAEGDVDVGAEGEGGGEGEGDSGDETSGSGNGTPKQQTKRQRGQDEGAFLALPMEPQIKKVLTADEHRMRRAEMARRRKNLSEKRNEEEKMSTINRLLKRQVPKRRGKAMNPETLEAATAAEGASPAEVEEIEVERANPLFVHWVSDKDGSRLGVPHEWLGKKVGRLFGPPPSGSQKLVEEVA